MVTDSGEFYNLDQDIKTDTFWYVKTVDGANFENSLSKREIAYISKVLVQMKLLNELGVTQLNTILAGPGGVIFIDKETKEKEENGKG